MRGQAGASTRWSRFSQRSTHPSQLRGVSQRPWTNTTGGAETSEAMGVSYLVGRLRTAATLGEYLLALGLGLGGLLTPFERDVGKRAVQLSRPRWRPA